MTCRIYITISNVFLDYVFNLLVYNKGRCQKWARGNCHPLWFFFGQLRGHSCTSIIVIPLPYYDKFCPPPKKKKNHTHKNNNNKQTGISSTLPPLPKLPHAVPVYMQYTSQSNLLDTCVVFGCEYKSLRQFDIFGFVLAKRRKCGEIATSNFFQKSHKLLRELHERPSVQNIQ